MSIHDFKVKAQDGSDVSLADYKGKPDAEDCKAAAAFAKKIVS